MSLSKSKGKLVHEYVWGRRRLAYEIEGNDFGVYHTWYFTGSGKTVDELKRQFGYSDNVLRHQIVKVEDLDTEAVFMQNLIPPKEERIEKGSSEEILQQGQETEKDISANSDNKELVEEEKIESERESESDKKESGNSAQEDDSDSSEV
jgi:ribosomal protein S6